MPGRDHNSGRGRNQGGGRGRGRHNHSHSKVFLSKSGGAVDGLSVLKYTSASTMEYQYTLWETDLKNYVQRQFGDIANIFIHGTYPSYTKELYDAQNTVIDPIDDPSGFKKKAVERKIQTLIDKEQKVNDDKVKIFAVIWGQLATDSQNKVAATNKWSDVNDTSDALELLTRVKNTHLTCGKADEEENMYEARNTYNKLYMHQLEALGDFKKRFDASIKAMVSVKQDIPSQTAQARDFFG